MFTANDQMRKREERKGCEWQAVLVISGGGVELKRSGGLTDRVV